MNFLSSENAVNEYQAREAKKCLSVTEPKILLISVIVEGIISLPEGKVDAIK